MWSLNKKLNYSNNQTGFSPLIIMVGIFLVLLVVAIYVMLGANPMQSNSKVTPTTSNAPLDYTRNSDGTLCRFPDEPDDCNDDYISNGDWVDDKLP